MKNNNIVILSGFILVLLALIAPVQAKEGTLHQQEALLEEELSSAASAEEITKITVALAQIKKQQSTQEFKRLPDMIGRDRSFLTSSVRENYTYRQMASSFIKEPGRSTLANSYHMANFLGICCIIFGIMGMIACSKYRY